MLVSRRSLFANAVAGFVCLNALPAHAQAQAKFPDEEPAPTAAASANAAPVAPPGTAAAPAATPAPAPAASAASPTTAEAPQSADMPVAEEPKPDDTRRLDIRQADANADRVVFLPTAETHPKGSLYFSAHELIFWQLGYAFSDRVQATVTTWPVIVKEQPFFLDGSIKVNLFRSNTLRLAAIGGLTYVAETVSDAHNTASVARLALAGQVCVTRGCWTSIVGSLSGWIPLNENAEGTLYMGGLGISSKLGRHVGLLLEVDSAGLYDNNFEFAQGALVNYGLRFSGTNIGVDLTMVKPTGAADTDLVMGIPWISFTYRTDPLMN